MEGREVREGDRKTMEGRALREGDGRQWRGEREVMEG